MPPISKKGMQTKDFSYLFPNIQKAQVKFLILLKKKKKAWTHQNKKQKKNPTRTNIQTKQQIIKQNKTYHTNNLHNATAATKSHEYVYW